MALVTFKRGPLSGLNALPIKDGQIIFVNDAKKIMMDVGTERVQFSDVVQVATSADLPATGDAGKICIVEDINALAFWNGTGWIQLNVDTGATSVEVTGTGNVITDASYDAGTRKITLTKGETAALKSELDELSDYVGTIPDTYTESNVISYINKKAEETLSAAQGGSSETAASVKLALDNYKTENDTAVAAAKTLAQQGVDAAATEKTRAEAAEQEIKDSIGEVPAESTVMGEIEANSAAIEAEKTRAEAAEKKISDSVGTVPEGKTVVQMIADAQTAATYDDTKVKEDIAANTSAIEAEVTRAKAAEEANAAAIATEKSRMDAFMALEDGQTLDNALDSLKELQDYITSEAADADVVVGKVAALEAIVDGIGDTANGEKATVVAYVTAAIDALKIGDYAKAADLTALASRVSALEAASATHAKAEDLTNLTTRVSTVEGDIKTINGDAETVGSIAKAQSDAEKHADDLNTAMDTRMKVVEGKAHSHENGDALESITSDKISAWDTAVTDLATHKTAYADKVAALEAEDAKIRTDFATADTTTLNSAKTYAEGLLTWGEF